jgi:secreted PhoX family phosphatase
MIKRILFSLLCVFAFGAKAQQVTLFAGSQYVGDGGYSGATGAINKLSDSFSIPWGIAVDTAGRFWITDQHNVSIIIGTTIM